jgi:hypothetical protein
MGFRAQVKLCNHQGMEQAITPEQREILLSAIENPPRGSALDRAKRWGVDLQALVDNLCLTPAERIRKMTRRVNLMLERARRKQLRKAARNKKSAGLTTCSSDEGREPS